METGLTAIPRRQRGRMLIRRPEERKFIVYLERREFCVVLAVLTIINGNAVKRRLLKCPQLGHAMARHISIIAFRVTADG